MSEVATRFRIPPLRLFFPLALWAAYILWMGDGVLTFGGTGPSGQYPSSFRTYAAVLFDLDVWGLAAGLIFGLMLFNPLGWLNGKRFIVGGLAFGIMMGRLSGVVLGYLLAELPFSGTVAFIAVPVLMLLAGIVVILILFVALTAVFLFLVGVPITLFNQILAFENAVHVYRYKARGLAGYIIRGVLWLRNETMPEQAPDDSKGARFATMDEIRRLHNPVREAMAFGHLGNPLYLKTDKHVLIMASTRSGKGVTLIMPHLLRYQGSAFVLDPKGENAKGTGRQRAALNSAVHYLDPFGISGKPQSRFNPLARFTPQNMEAESKALAAAIFVVGERERDHWTASGQQLLATLILYVYVCPDFAPANKDLPMVRRLLLGNLEPALKDMIGLDAADGLLRDLAMSFVATPEKEFGSIVSTAQRQTEILDNPYMVACLSAQGDGPEVDFKAWHTGTMTVYLCLSAPKFPTFNRWLRLVLTSALDEMTDTLNPPALPVCFMLDELATLGHLTAVENAVGLAAGYGIQLVTVFQDVAQMRGLYKGRWASFIGNAGVRALFNLDDYETAEYWSKFVGNRIVETHSRQEDTYGLSQGQSVGENMRPLLATDQLMMMFATSPAPAGAQAKPSKMLVLAQGAHPIVADRVAYWNDSSLNGLWDDPRAPAARPLQPTSPPPRPNGSGPSPAQPAGPATPRTGPSPAPPPSAPTFVPAPASSPPEPVNRHLVSDEPTRLTPRGRHPVNQMPVRSQVPSYVFTKEALSKLKE